MYWFLCPLYSPDQCAQLSAVTGLGVRVERFGGVPAGAFVVEDTISSDSDAGVRLVGAGSISVNDDFAVYVFSEEGQQEPADSLVFWAVGAKDRYPASDLGFGGEKRSW